MNPTVTIKTKYTTDEIIVISSNIQEVKIETIGSKYRVLVTLVSGRTYFLADDSNKDIFNSIEEAKLVRDNFESSL